MAVIAAVHWAVICACVWSDRVWRDSHSSCKSSAALLLKMEQHTILSFVNLSPWPPSFSLPCSSAHCLAILSVLLCLGCCFPVSSVSVPSSPSLLSMARSPVLTDRQRERDGISVTESSGTQWPQLPNRWGDNWLNESPYTLTHFLLASSSWCSSGPAVEAFGAGAHRLILMAPLLHYIDVIVSVLKTINYLEFTFKNKVTTRRIVLQRVFLAKSQHIGYLPIIFLFTFVLFFQTM